MMNPNQVTEVDEAILEQVQTLLTRRKGDAPPIEDFAVRMEELESFRYRVEDAARAVGFISHQVHEPNGFDSMHMNKKKKTGYKSSCSRSSSRRYQTRTTCVREA